MPNLVFQTIHFFYLMGLVVWMGSLISASFILAPGVFGVVSDRRLAGDIVGRSLDIMRGINMFAVPVTFIADVLLYEMYKVPTILNNIHSMLLLLMTLIFYYGVFVVTPAIKKARAKMREERSDMDEIALLSAEFSALHRTSLNVSMGQIIIGLFVVFFS